MKNDQFNINPEELQVYMERANKLRAEAIRASFIDLKTTIKITANKVLGAFKIPRTEQL